MSKPQPVELPSYDVLSQLARNDPAAYEAWRCEVIDDFINSAPDKIKPRLRGLQWRVECVRKQSKTALGSAVRLNDLMWKSFLCLNDRWHDLADMAAERAELHLAMSSGKPETGCSAQIIEFPGRGTRSQLSTKSDDDLVGQKDEG